MMGDLFFFGDVSSELRYIHGGLADLLYLLITVIDPNALSRAKVKKM